MSEPTLRDKVLALLRTERMLSAGDRVLVAVSGGADSLALLHFLVNEQVALELREVAAAHIHHGLRGEEADRDERVVRDFCASCGVRLFVCHADVAAEARRRGDGVEEAGRAVRYAFLERIAAENGFDRIATAHTLTDATETVLLNMARGTGLGGLTGIPPVRGRIIRPLLAVTRAEVEAYDAAAGIAFVTDSSNADVTFSRNRVRREVLPALRQLNPRVDEAFARLMRTVRADEDYLRKQTAAALQSARITRGLYRADTLHALHPALAARAVRLAVEESAGVCCEERHLRAVLALLATGGSVTVNGAVDVTVHRDRLVITARGGESPAEQPLEDGREYVCGGIRWHCSVFERKNWEKRQKIHKILLQFTCDYDKMGDKAVVRGRRAGDIVHPVHGNGGKTLKKWMNERHVPTAWRDTFPILSDEKGVFLVPGLGCDRRVALDDKTQHILAFFIEEDKECGMYASGYIGNPVYGK